MYYPAVFAVPGIIFLLTSLTSYTNSTLAFAVFMTAFLSLFVNSLWLTSAILIGGAAICAGMGDPNSLSIAGSTALAVILLGIAIGFKCPRCRFMIQAGRNPFTQPHRKWCPICGRTRRGVWPFQHSLKPESWDGQYHDDGGGPDDGDSVRGWQRDRIYKRYLKRRGR
ncbi:hypothetical protein [Asticcacaulis sp. YBE204]|uniref:hypothetical protein n=1 Tax=Asticcacaulis sp. YBE204 TaxID=1282363 RepID=UPI0003C3EE37|nr:hypothetical protein [Asticcacaulis sp. YBE204]ESQ80897.1 hypothetical protein AEYBE204_00830 [Asticcacaulis sp. YBE204]